MKYEINRKNIKQSVTTLATFLTQNGFKIPRHLILDAFSKTLFFKNWNTLEGMSTDPEQIRYIKKEKRYIFEIEIRNCTKETVLNLFTDSFTEANATFNMVNFLNDGDKYHIELDMIKGANNTITAIIILGKKLKPKYEVIRLDLCRIEVDTEQLIGLVKKQ